MEKILIVERFADDIASIFESEKDRQFKSFKYR